ncbi:flagellar biosynthesis anti-sigma factor FlgM [Vogesella oryzae]|uniref:flagellar biosynthesis anti-sigma factor FlgM n=1 Tax=Vogesella oryzae TaxID=1735285 RepID=UPI00158373AF|nr:flagellar biosynthesis anti-sigma factor FlgM [Vogesella oryzae]
MKITSSSTGIPEIRDATPAAGNSADSGAAGRTVAAAAPAAPSAPLQSAVMQPAQEALAAMPDIDAERVADIKAALAEGKINFDAGKLAGLIRRYHGGRG